MGVGRVTGHRGLELYGGHTAEAALAAEPVVGLLDPAEDRNVEVLARLPGLPVEHAVLRERQERFHGRGATDCLEFPADLHALMLRVSEADGPPCS